VSRTSRILAALATVVVLVIAFAVLSPGGDDDTTPTTTSTTSTAPTTSTVAPAPTSSRASIVVRAGKPVGGIEKITLKKGSRAIIQVSSPDTSDEIHIHGYDLKKDLEAGGRVRFAFTAKTDGVYEIELEDAGVQIAQLVVEP
jgi:heme/copper-type cytochrome/quinol oxidase subunit 2